MANIEQRLEALEKMHNVADRVNVILIKGMGGERITHATCGDMVFAINPEETESEFETRIIKSSEAIPNDGMLRVFYMWQS